MSRISILLIISLSLLFTCHSEAQQGRQTRKPLTNTDVIRMVRAGVADETIVVAIQTGHTAFDTSTDGLIALSKAGVDATVVKAVLSARDLVAGRSAGVSTSHVVEIAKPISDTFAVTGLKALRAVQGSLAMPSVNGGSLTVPSALKGVVDQADAEAKSPEEKELVIALNQIFKGHLFANLSEETIKMSAGYYDAASEARANAVVAANANVRAYENAESDCGRMIEGALRDRTLSSYPVVCKTLVSTALAIK